MGTHLKNPLVWLHGLIAALIGGGSSGVMAGIAAIGLDPAKFDLSTNIGNTFKMVGAVFVMAGITSVFSYLKQSPLPPIEEDKPV